jgi:hypothetical protein
MAVERERIYCSGRSFVSESDYVVKALSSRFAWLPNDAEAGH